MQAKLKQLFSSARVPQTYLVLGDDLAKAEVFARALGRALLCEGEQPPCGKCRGCTLAQHPDFIEPLGEKVKIDDLRDLVRDAHILPNEGARKVYLLPDAGRIEERTQNALLAVLETPPKHVCFVLTARQASDLLPTVVSRCSQIRCNGTAPSGLFPEQTEPILRALLTRDELTIYRAVSALEGFKRPELAPILEALRTLLRDHTIPAQELSYSELIALADALRKAEGGIRRNLGVSTILAALAVRMTQAMAN